MAKIIQLCFARPTVLDAPSPCHTAMTSPCSPIFTELVDGMHTYSVRCLLLRICCGSHRHPSFACCICRHLLPFEEEMPTYQLRGLTLQYRITAAFMVNGSHIYRIRCTAISFCRAQGYQIAPSRHHCEQDECQHGLKTHRRFCLSQACYRTAIQSFDRRISHNISSSQFEHQKYSNF